MKLVQVVPPADPLVPGPPRGDGPYPNHPVYQQRPEARSPLRKSRVSGGRSLSLRTK
ncbi:MAG: hypothetical protein F6K30_20985 [Cyanothece sp. SIO2G6]|nr:hypothetical protein [Cyanothece sp. SIO2G6]